jgi:glycosyltransferase involved in cell wall biosynthesis
LKILHLYKDYAPVLGGIENHVKVLAEAQAARGYDVSVLVTSRDRRTHVEMIGGVRVLYAARLATISSAPVSLAMFTLLRREMPDIVHLHFPYPPGEVANLFMGRAHHTVVTYHSDIVRQRFLRLLYAPMMHQVLVRADRILATSPNYIASSPVLSRWQTKCTVVPLGIDPTPFEDPAPSDSFRERVRGKGKGVLLFVGHLRYYKGLSYLLQALREIPNARLLVVGVGPMERPWRVLAQELGLEGRVQFVGDVPGAELPFYFAVCDVFVLPSSERSEAFGLVQLEAMAAGKPVVCTELGTGTSFVNVNGATGFVVPARDPRALASAITRLIADDGLRARMGAAGRARVHQEFLVEEMVDRVVAMYKDLIFRNN